MNFINHLKAQTSKVVCEAEYALFTRQAKDAELILLNSGLIYRAIKLNIRLFNWDRYARHILPPMLLGYNCNVNRESGQNIR